MADGESGDDAPEAPCCAWSGVRAETDVNARQRARRRTLRPLGIDALEILEHHAALLGRQPAEVGPRRELEFRCRLAADRPRWREDLGSGGGACLALPLLVPLVLFQRTPGIEHAPEQPLLALEHVAIHLSLLEGLRELPGLLRQLVGLPR